jgi:predicted outer membrane repeat protein
MTNSEEIQSEQYTGNTPGLGTVRTSHQNINFQGQNIFKGNWGTALYVVNAIVNFQKSSASFVNNIGLQGGAVALVGSSTLIVGPHDYVFHNNSAYYQGGAIYVLLIDHFDIEVSQSCFIEYADDGDDVEIENIDHTDNEWKANITFTDNHILRGRAGCTIFATSLYSCQVINNGTKDQPEYVIVPPKVALKRRGIKINDHYVNCTYQVATDGAKFHNIIIGSAAPLMIIPGKEYSHNITATDDLGQDINNSVPFRVVIHDPNDPKQLSNDITPSTTYIEDKIQLMGKPNQTEHAVLRLHTLSARQIFIEANITLVECPPGFVLVNESRPRCVCNEKAPVGIFKCNLKEFHSHLLPGYWAGLVEGTPKLVTSTCPFCEYNVTSKSEFDIGLPQNYSELNKTICGNNRTGVVCGICQNNYTVHFHSPNFKCKSKEPFGCKLGWLFYILSEIIPVTVVFIIILLFNISFTSGTISSFILFSQLLVTLDINASGIIKFSYPVKHRLGEWAQGYLMLYGIFNLNFFNSEHLSFCIMTNASALDMIAFKYVTIFYTLILILSVIWIMNKCGGRCCGKFCRITTVKSSVVHGLSSFLVMCYTRCVQVSMNLLNPVHFNVEMDSGFTPQPRVWLNGNIKYFSNEHLPYAFPALFCLLTIGVLPPALLLCYPLLNKVTAFFGCDDVNINCLFCHKLSVSYLKPLLDSFQSCFRDNMRFFAGLYFLYRWIILLVYVVTHSYSIYYITIIGGLVGILALHAICQPYVKRSHNIIDILLLANLIIISCLSFYNYHRNHYLRGVKHSTTTPAAIVQLVLVYLPLIVLCAYILMIVCKTVKKRKKIVFSASDKLVPRRANRLREFIRTISEESDDSDEVELTHDQLMDEDVSFDENVCNYFKASGDTEMVLLNT